MTLEESLQALVELMVEVQQALLAMKPQTQEDKDARDLALAATLRARRLATEWGERLKEYRESKRQEATRGPR